MIHAEKLAIFSAYAEVNEREVRNYLIEKWETITQGMNDSTMLFMAGIHGSDQGTIGPKARSLEIMKVQIKEILPRDYPQLKRDIEERKIKFEYLDMFDFYDPEKCKQIKEDELIQEITRIDPQIIIMVICFSRILQCKFLLEENGLLSCKKLNRELNLSTGGKIITLNESQKKFIQTVAVNIEKKIVHIEGLVGSGKTLLGIEIVKMKLAHYIRKYNLSVNDLERKMKVIILADDFNAKVLMEQMSNELPKEIGDYATVHIESKSILDGVLEDQINDNNDDFKHTIVMIDECFYDKNQAYLVHLSNIDFIHCIRYNQLGQQFSEVAEDVFVDDKMVFCQLFKCQRSSQEILDLADYMQRHSPESFPINPTQANGSFSSSTPIWIEFESTQEFVSHASSFYSDKKDVLIIGEERNEMIEDLCKDLNQTENATWRFCHTTEIRGCEASVVIIHDLNEFRYEAFTRAKHELIIVTYTESANDMKRILKDVYAGVHNYDYCNAYRQRYLMKGETLKKCQYKLSRKKISNLLEKYESIEVDDLDSSNQSKRSSMNSTTLRSLSLDATSIQSKSSRTSTPSRRSRISRRSIRPKSMIPEVQNDQNVQERQVVLINSDEANPSKGLIIKLPLEGLDFAKPYRPPMFGNQASSSRQFVELGPSPLVSKSIFLKALISIHQFSTVQVGGKAMPDIKITFDIQDEVMAPLEVPVCSRSTKDSKGPKNWRFKLKLK